MPNKKILNNEFGETIADPPQPEIAALQLVPEQSYFEKRMQLLGVTPEHNTILIRETEVQSGPNQGNEVLKPYPIFTEGTQGIDIFMYTLDRCKIWTHKDAQRSGHTIKAADKVYKIIRLYPERVNKDGKVQKYHIPKGEPTRPFFPPGLVAKYDACREWKAANPGKRLPPDVQVRDLFITEGAFKAFKGDMGRIDVVGVPSITCLRDKDTDELHADIQKLILVCEVENAIWLTDGDCRSLTTSELKEDTDLYHRPSNFFDTISNFFTALSKFPDVQRYFAHINSEDLEGNPKGLDDLLCQFPDRGAQIAAEFGDFSKLVKGGIVTGTYRVLVNIQHNLSRIRKYFFLDDVTQFFLFHSERRADLKALPHFKFNGTQYRYNEAEGKCDVEMPGSANDYIRMGNDYYKYVMIPTSNSKTEKIVKTLVGRMKGTIIDDHGKQFIQYIKKYDAPCVMPDHGNYQQVINNCYNLYQPFRHEPEDGDCELTIEFIKHLFSEEVVTYTDRDGIVTSIPRYELGLDYITLAYKNPLQMLPILCFVSRERQSGKTTFINWIEALFSDNAISIGNEDIEADFNAHWAGKLFISVDETKVDNGKVINKIKRLSTAQKIVLNSKGKDQVILRFFAKFILNSNHVEDFIRIDKEEIRFWIHKVPPLKRTIPKFLEKLVDEIPAFLHYLEKRTMASKDEERHWFATPLLHTQALVDVKNNSMSNMEKRIRTELQEMFDMCDAEMFRISAEGLATDILKKSDKRYVITTLKEMGYKTKPCARGVYPVRAERTVRTLGDEGKESYLEPKIFHGAYYEFHRKDFTDTDPKNAELQPFGRPYKPAAGTDEKDVTAAAETTADLPF